MGNELTFTIWSNAGRHEWVVRRGEAIVQRSGLVFPNRSAAKRDMIKNMGDQ